MGMKCWSDPTAKDAYRLSWASLGITLVAAFCGIVLWMVSKRGRYSNAFILLCLFLTIVLNQRLDLSLALVFGLENCVDFFSSAVVLWRFYAPHQLDEALVAKLKGREVRASVAISFILIILGIQVIASASSDIARGKEDEEAGKQAAIAISFFSMPIFGTLAVLKFRYAKALESESLYKDGVCSLIGAVLAVALFLNTLIIHNSPNAWWLDPVIALFAGFIAFFYGIYGVHVAKSRDKHAVFSLAWWNSSGEVPIQPPKSASTEMVDAEVV